jgi:hypothetical protein
VAEPYDRTYGDMANSGWQTLDESVSTCGSFLVNDWVPRGPVMGCTWHPGIGICFVC